MLIELKEKFTLEESILSNLMQYYYYKNFNNFIKVVSQTPPHPDVLEPEELRNTYNQKLKDLFTIS